jgi:hypothetical protein
MSAPGRGVNGHAIIHTYCIMTLSEIYNTTQMCCWWLDIETSRDQLQHTRTIDNKSVGSVSVSTNPEALCTAFSTVNETEAWSGDNWVVVQMNEDIYTPYDYFLNSQSEKNTCPHSYY